MKPQMLRAVIVTLMLGFTVLLDAPDLQRVFGHPLGVVDIATDYTGVVTDAGPRERAAGIRPGDRLDTAHASIDQRIAFNGVGYASGTDQVTYALVRGGRQFSARVRPVLESQDRIAMVWLRDAIAALAAFLGALVVLKKPNRATWAFFAFIFIGVGPVNVVYQIGPQWWHIAAYYLFQLEGFMPAFGAMFFALYILHDGPLGRKRTVAQAVLIALTLFEAVLLIVSASAVTFAGAPPPALTLLISNLAVIPYFIAVAILAITYFERRGVGRERLRWIIAGFVVGSISYFIDNLGTQGNLGLIQMSYTTHSILVCGDYLAPGLAVAYAVLKHHIIDIDFAISKATVYGILSVGIVGVFALVDLFFTRALAAKDGGLIADVGLALALGFAFNAMHHRVDAFVDRILFRRRHLAEEHVASLAGAISYARDDAHVKRMLIDEPVRAFSLKGAEFLGRGIDGRLAAEPFETIAASLEAERKPMRVAPDAWGEVPLEDAGTAALAVPVFVHGGLAAIAMYGGHRNGTDLDSDEIRLIEALAKAAGSAIERLEADALRERVKHLERRLAAAP